MVFFVTLLLPPPLLSCILMALSVEFTILFAVATTPVAEFKLMPSCTEVMLFEVTLTTDPACWKLMPLLA